MRLHNSPIAFIQDIISINKALLLIIGNVRLSNDLKYSHAALLEKQ